MPLPACLSGTERAGRVPCCAVLWSLARPLTGFIGNTMFAVADSAVVLRKRPYVSRNGGVSLMKADPKVLKHALRLAGGDRRRLKIDKTVLDINGRPTVLVLNPSYPKR